MHTLIQESEQSCNPLSMLIACSFSSKEVYKPLNGTEQLTKDSQHAPHLLTPSPISSLDRLLHTHTMLLHRTECVLFSIYLLMGLQTWVFQLEMAWIQVDFLVVECAFFLPDFGLLFSTYPIFLEFFYLCINAAS